MCVCERVYVCVCVYMSGYVCDKMDRRGEKVEEI